MDNVNEVILVSILVIHLIANSYFVLIVSSIKEYHDKFYPTYVAVCNRFKSV